MVTKRVKKDLFLNFRGPIGMLQQVFLVHFEPVVMHFRPQQIPQCFENGSFLDRKWVKYGSKKHFMLDHLR